MVTETLETQAAPPSEEANQAPIEQTQTETPATKVAESAVAPSEEAVASKPDQIEVERPTPVGMTRAEAEAFFNERETKVREDERLKEQNRRRTENARKAAAEKRETEERAETIDVVRATLASKLGVDASLITDDAIDTAIGRAARKRAEGMTASSMEVVEQAFDYLTAPAYGKEEEWSDEYTAAAGKLGPKLQHLINTIRPQIEAKAREGFIAETDLGARVDAEIARRAAQSREGQEELKRVEGAPAGSAEHGSREWWSSIGAEGRAKQENQQAFDAWIAKNR